MRLIIPRGDTWAYANGIEDIQHGNAMIRLPSGRRRIVPVGGPK
jgi:hypothetical protein